MWRGRQGAAAREGRQTVCYTHLRSASVLFSRSRLPQIPNARWMLSAAVIERGQSGGPGGSGLGTCARPASNSSDTRPSTGCACGQTSSCPLLPPQAAGARSAAGSCRPSCEALPLLRSLCIATQYSCCRVLRMHAIVRLIGSAPRLVPEEPCFVTSERTRLVNTATMVRTR